MPLMVFGMFEAEFRVRTAQGEGTLRVPVTSRNPQPLRMATPVATALVVLVAFLMVSGFAIARSVGADGARDPGARRTAADARRGLLAGTATTGGFAVFVAFSCVTWRAMHRAFEERAQPSVSAEWIVRSGNPRSGKPLDALVTLTGPDGPVGGLLASGGELLHVTSVTPDGTELAHVHGRRTPSGAFEVTWTPREIGRQTVFVDFATRATGEITVVQDLIVSPSDRVMSPLAPALPSAVLPRFGEARSATQPFGSGTATWREPVPELTVGDVRMLEFEADPPLGRTELEVLRDDLQVHDRIVPAEDAPPGVARFAMGLPSAGRYRLVLEESGDPGRTAAFDVVAR
jgi:hypothetical protein